MQRGPSLHEDRFKQPIGDCDVEDKKKLESYRALWLKWMRWYDHSPGEANTIESQLQTLIFNDLVYRTVSGARGAGGEEKTSARDGTLVYLLDVGYVATQVLALLRLLDKTRGAVSVIRLLMEVETKRTTITREVYVSGFGLPYDPDSWKRGGARDSPMVQSWGIEAPELRYWSDSDGLHRVFDRLSNTDPGRRSRTDVIARSVFERMHGWLRIPEVEKLENLWNEFLAHAADAVGRKSPTLETVHFGEIDKVQKSIIRTERALTDCVLTRRVAREVPMPPLGLYADLDLPYAARMTQNAMYSGWDQLAKERNSWPRGVIEALVGKAQADGEVGPTS